MRVYRATESAESHRICLNHRHAGAWTEVGAQSPSLARSEASNLLASYRSERTHPLASYGEDRTHPLASYRADAKNRFSTHRSTEPPMGARMRTLCRCSQRIPRPQDSERCRRFWIERCAGMPRCRRRSLLIVPTGRRLVLSLLPRLSLPHTAS
jgi:hypothetical protein